MVGRPVVVDDIDVDAIRDDVARGDDPVPSNVVSIVNWHADEVTGSERGVDVIDRSRSRRPGRLVVK